MEKEAIKNFESGYSCSESIVKAAYDTKLTDKNLTALATPFSGGMSSGCLCGAVAGAQIIIGELFGRQNNENSSQKAKELAKKFVDEFKKENKFTCCKALTAGFDFSSPERKNHCKKMVASSAKILENLIAQNK